MRRILAAEGRSIGGNSFEGLSMEELDVLVDEAVVADQEATSDLVDAGRAIDVAEALEDLAVVAEPITEATPTEIALVDTTAQMAVAGTDLAPEEIIPESDGVSLESRVGRRIAVEGIKETVANIWRGIKALLKKIWAKVEEFFYKIFGAIPSLRRTIKALRANIDDLGSKVTDEKTIKMTSGIASLTVDGKSLKTASEISTAVAKQVDAVKVLSGNYSKNIAKILEHYADVAADFDANDPDKALLAISAGALKDINGLKATVGASGNVKRWPGFTASNGEHLMGNTALFVRVADAGDTTSAIGILEKVRASGVILAKSNESKKDLPDEVAITAPTTGDLNKMVDGVEKLLDVLEDWNRGSAVKDIKRAREALEKATDKAETSFNKIDRESRDEHAAAAFRAIANLNKAAIDWAKEPISSVIRESLTHARVVLAVTSKGISNHKTK